MRVVFVLLDSLVRNQLACYGADYADTGNFARLAARGVTFDTHYVGSLPCIPARRDLHTGRVNFLHRNWGPLEPFDDSYARTLSQAGVYTHLVSDHFHYLEDGGVAYHTAYNSFEMFRGQEVDLWKGWVEPPVERFRETYHPRQHGLARDSYELQNYINREFIRTEAEFPTYQTFSAGLEFIERNRGADNWLLNIEAFDPHEPFVAPPGYHDRYQTDYKGPTFDWPRYDRVAETPEEIRQIRANYAGNLDFVDKQLGRLLDAFDAHNLWRDTALVLSTDHGFLLGEHEWWAKVRQPCFDEIARIPLLVYHPDFAHCAGQRRRALTQTIDVMPTLLDCFGIRPGPAVEGRSLLPLLGGECAVRDAAIYGYWGGAINVTDGRHTYFRYPEGPGRDVQLYLYTLVPYFIPRFLDLKELAQWEPGPAFGFTKGIRTMKIPSRPRSVRNDNPAEYWRDAVTVLYDVVADAGQGRPLDVPDIERVMLGKMRALMVANEAPPEAFLRMDIDIAGLTMP